MSEDTLTPGTIYIKKQQDTGLYVCKMFGDGMLGSGITGVGETTRSALANYNLQAWNRHEDIKDAKKEAEKRKRFEERQKNPTTFDEIDRKYSPIIASLLGCTFGIMALHWLGLISFHWPF